MAQGGYRKPSNPAPVGLPGAMSQRTDGGPADKQPQRYISGLGYGEGQAMMNIQGAAPMEASAPTPSMSAARQAPSQPINLTPLNAPSQNPNEPVTSGANAGAGPDMSSLGLGSQDTAADAQARAALMSYMPALLQVASQPGTSPETRNIIRSLREMM